MKFAKNTIKFICSYLIERYQYLQIEDKGSTLLSMFFGVPHKSILGPVLFNLYLGELADRTYSKTIQYVSSAHPVRIQYQHWKISTLGECAVEIQKMWKGCSLGHNKTICIQLCQTSIYSIFLVTTEL